MQVPDTTKLAVSNYITRLHLQATDSIRLARILARQAAIARHRARYRRRGWDQRTLTGHEGT
jgi:hypothetical protein